MEVLVREIDIRMTKVQVVQAQVLPVEVVQVVQVNFQFTASIVHFDFDARLSVFTNSWFQDKHADVK